MTKPMGLLAVGFDYSGSSEDEFNDWYDTEHIPQRLRVKGFVNAERWVGADDPKISLVTYDLASPGVLQSASYLAIAGANLSPWSRRVAAKCRRIGRFVAEQIVPGSQAAPQNAGGLLFVGMNVEPRAEDEFNDWYDTEHLPRLMAVPGCLCARRFRAAGGSHKYIAIYHLESAEVCASRTWKDAVATPWTAKIIPHTSVHLRIPVRRYTRRV
ncbi:MAG: hypothetical protein Q7R45_05580 [Sulfuricaulis sp.]|nr:hypothetical protein [Sulfuricaulis sp.]